MSKKPKHTILAGYRVLDLTDEKGLLCVRLLARMGAKVVNITPENESGRFRELVKNTDILVETSPERVAYKELTKINPRLIAVSITPFGQTGSYKDFKASDLTLQALGGWLSVTGETDKPLKLFGNQAYHTASLFAVNGILLALRQRRITGKGQHLDISIMECVAATLDYVLPRYFYEGVVSQRRGSLHWNNAFRVFPCKDGYILLTIHYQWDTLVELLAYDGMAGDLADAKWQDREMRNRHIDHVIEILERWTLSHKVKEMEEKGQLMRFPWAGVVGAKHE
jgi:crotonobetainyl-CoA:carnitine CoA-transferase CaiB-like acyl-CoA transferase